MHPYKDCHNCNNAFYEPTQPNGDLACLKCGELILASESEPEMTMTQAYWETVRENMLTSGQLAIDHVRHGDAEVARFFAVEAAHDARHLEKFNRL